MQTGELVKVGTPVEKAYHNPDCRVCKDVQGFGFLSMYEKDRNDDPGCPFTKIRHWLRKFTPDFLDDKYDDIEYPDHIIIRQVMRKAWPLDALAEHERPIGGWRIFGSSLSDAASLTPKHAAELAFESGSMSTPNGLLYFQLYTEAGSKNVPGIREATGPEPGKSNDDEAAWEFVTEQRRICDSDHSLCRAAQLSQIQFLPPRMLEIRANDLRLVDATSLASNCSYIALSYCWGISESICATAANIAKLYETISLDVLPAVVKDTITFASKMEVAYLWIDRLCILQGDPEDWAKNSSMMREIYGHADIVLCAASSASVEDNFLGQVNGSIRTAMFSVPVDLGSDDEQAGQARLRLRCLAYSASGKNPLDLRAWAFQERFLANRCVRYEQGQIVWECTSVTVGEIYSGYHVYGRQYAFDKLRRGGTLTSNDWSLAVDAYTQRNIKNSGDRLPAISGLASKFAESLKCRYIAGLWESSFLPDLHWAVIDAESDQAKGPCVAPGAPSWSWASLSLAIGHRIYRDDQWRPIAKIIDFSCLPSTPNRFGSVSVSSFIQVTSLTLDVDLKLPLQKNPEIFHNYTRLPAKGNEAAPLDEPDHLTCEGLPTPPVRVIELDGSLQMHLPQIGPERTHLDDKIQLQGKSWQRSQGDPDTATPTGCRAPVKLLFTIIARNRRLSALILTPAMTETGVFKRIGFMTIFFHSKLVSEHYLSFCRRETIKII